MLTQQLLKLFKKISTDLKSFELKEYVCLTKFKNKIYWSLGELAFCLVLLS
jgi:hypothetical protein